MLVDRETQIMSFKKEKYHIVRLDLEGTEAASARISDREKAEELKDACQASKAVCVSVNREKKGVAPPKLFDLTTLQREANKL
jgi:DNA topoisomerase-3